MTQKSAGSREEMMFPEVSGERFSVAGKTFQIRQMPYLYEKKILKLMGPGMERVFSKPVDRIIECLMDEAIEILPEIVTIICQVTDEAITREWVEKHMIVSDMVDVVQKQLEKNRLMDKVGDFFQRLAARREIGIVTSLSS